MPVALEADSIFGAVVARVECLLGFIWLFAASSSHILRSGTFDQPRAALLATCR